jgi:hypothetical protein
MDYKYFKLTGRLVEMALGWQEKYFAFVKERAKKIELLTDQTYARLFAQELPYGERDVIGVSVWLPGTRLIKDKPEFFKPDLRTVNGRKLQVTFSSFRTGIPFSPVLKELAILRKAVTVKNRLYCANIYQSGDHFYLEVPTLMVTEHLIKHRDLIQVFGTKPCP